MINKEKHAQSKRYKYVKDKLKYLITRIKDIKKVQTE